MTGNKMLATSAPGTCGFELGANRRIATSPRAAHQRGTPRTGDASVLQRLRQQETKLGWTLNATHGTAKAP